MTSEVALLNRSAVALAADSAVTVRYWNRQRGRYDVRYLESANKIFHLSATQPVAAMIYSAADVQGAPWELLIKSYRDHLGSNAHDDLEDYAKGLCDFIATNQHIFSTAFQEEQFKKDSDLASAKVFSRIVGTKDFKGAKTDADALAIFKRDIAKELKTIEAATFLANAIQADSDSAVAKYKPAIKAMLEKDRFYSQHGAAKIDYESLAEAGIKAIFKTKHTTLRDSGVVIAGFGVKDYFPRLEAYVCYGLVLGKLIWEQESGKTQKISQQNGSAIVPFAQDEMIRTFIFGMGASGISKVEEEFDRAQDAFYDKLLKAGLAPDISGDAAKVKALDAAKNESKTSFYDAVLQDLVDSHAGPLRQVIGMLSFAELAELAETLISIESLKERVTRPSESVGGPVDVAVISKNDGFIWIKRKHYFDARLNPRYFATHGIKGTT